MYSDRFPGKGLLAFSDPAGAKACLALAAMLREADSAQTVRAFSNKDHAFYAHWPTPVTVLPGLDLEALPERPDWIFTGTSHPQSSACFEALILRQACALGISTTAFVDHWTNLGTRFRIGDESVLPDTIWVLDERAKEVGIGDGLPEAVLEIHNNPYLDYIADYWKPALNKEQVLEQASVAASQFVLYVPDPISLRNENGEWQFDECSALIDIARAMKGLNGSALIVKPHPLQPMDAMNQALEEARLVTDIPVAYAPPIDNLELAAAAQVVLGFYSNFLIEANALGKAIVRYFPSGGERDTIAHLGIGSKLEHPAALRSELTTLLSLQ